MPVWVAAIVGGFLEVCSSLVGRVLVALGIGLVTYTGLNTGLNIFKEKMIASVNSAGTTAAGIIGVLQLDAALSVLLAAVALKMTLAGANSDVMKRWMVK